MAVPWLNHHGSGGIGVTRKRFSQLRAKRIDVAGRDHHMGVHCPICVEEFVAVLIQGHVERADRPGAVVMARPSRKRRLKLAASKSLNPPFGTLSEKV